jgi:CHASE2 domain-containing sensor protein
MQQAQRYSARLRGEWLLGLAGTTLLAVLLTLTSVWRPAGDLLFDHIQRWRGFQPTADIVVVTIDDRSIAELGGWPLRRQHYAKLLEHLAHTPYQPRVVGMNLLFVDPQADDAQLAKALAMHRAVLPVGFLTSHKLFKWPSQSTRFVNTLHWDILAWCFRPMVVCEAYARTTVATHIWPW